MGDKLKELGEFQVLSKKWARKIVNVGRGAVQNEMKHQNPELRKLDQETFGPRDSRNLVKCYIT